MQAVGTARLQFIQHRDLEQLISQRMCRQEDVPFRFQIQHLREIRGQSNRG